MRAWIGSTVAVAGVMLAAAPSAHAAKASCYGPGLFGNPMADGATLTHGTVAVAHKELPLGTRLYVRTNGRTIKVRVRDRGPYVGDRVLDVTEAAARELGFSNCDAWGVRKVTAWRSR